MKKAHLTVMIFALYISSCKPKEVVVENQQEFITTVIMTFTDNSTGVEKQFTYKDLDGDGGEPANVSVEPLMANRTYQTQITLLNEGVSPTENINEEILAEDEEHQFFFLSTSSNLSFTYADQDEDGNPLGLSTLFTTGAADSGSLTAILRHEPDKNAEGVAGGMIDNAGGAIDVEVAFDFTIQ